jgi:large subunit ribosomal protein L22
MSDINASFKDLCAVCDSIRYKPLPSALMTLDSVLNDGMPIEYKRHNKYMGSRHELKGKKGRYPVKCVAIVRKVVVNASANAKNKGEDPELMYVVHASANKTYEVPRMPSKGSRHVVTGTRRSNMEFAKVEIGISSKESAGLGSRMKRALKAVTRNEKANQKAAPKKDIKPTRKLAPVTRVQMPVEKKEEKKTE